MNAPYDTTVAQNAIFSSKRLSAIAADIAGWFPENQERLNDANDVENGADQIRQLLALLEKSVDTEKALSMELRIAQETYGRARLEVNRLQTKLDIRDKELSVLNSKVAAAMVGLSA